ncbi:MAG TPA: cupredoxin family copper-binding protein [Acidimicrobiales bacterium]|nr:cupredoxin family copper-binding protein [Acidimicrobiales bacterium]
MPRRLRLIALVVMIAAVLAACGTSDDDLRRTAAPATGTAAATVVIDDMAFSPETVEIPAGDTVAWVWRDSATHDVAFADGAASPKQKSGSWQRTFSQPGTYDYVCTLHPNMRGTVVVR